MGQVRDGSATTARAVRPAIQRSQVKDLPAIGSRPGLRALAAKLRARHQSEDGLSRLPDVDGDKPKRQRLKRNPIGFFHIDMSERQTSKETLYLFLVIDRTRKFAVTQLIDKADRKTAWELLKRLLSVVPYPIHTI